MPIASPIPASPAKPPPIASATTIQTGTAMPRRWAASGLPPIALISTPQRDEEPCMDARAEEGRQQGRVRVAGRLGISGILRGPPRAEDEIAHDERRNIVEQECR